MSLYEMVLFRDISRSVFRPNFYLLDLIFCGYEIKQMEIDMSTNKLFTYSDNENGFLWKIKVESECWKSIMNSDPIGEFVYTYQKVSNLDESFSDIEDDLHLGTNKTKVNEFVDNLRPFLNIFDHGEVERFSLSKHQFGKIISTFNGDN